MFSGNLCVVELAGGALSDPLSTTQSSLLPKLLESCSAQLSVNYGKL